MISSTSQQYALRTTRWIVPVMLGFSLTLTAWWATSTAANSLPAVGAFDVASPRAPIAAALVVVIVATVLLPVLGEPRLVAAELRAGGTRLVRVLGLAPRTGLVRLGLVGVGAGVVALLVAGALIRVPVLAETNVVDARDTAISGAHPVVAGMYLALHGAVWEELFYRGPVLVVAWVTARARPTVRWPLTIGAILLSSALFGAAHLSWSLANAVTAAATGVIFGAVAVARRSLWPAMLAHGTMNFLIGLM
ncbi:MAG TPA: CPBP family intramembrane glutamic endopeptidase [Demequina sp.]|nr:CPBP family intramembrane glutamic endopeptidase [Demequina sp.]